LPARNVNRKSLINCPPGSQWVNESMSELTAVSDVNRIQRSAEVNGTDVAVHL
jgi:hypothetical protein